MLSSQTRRVAVVINSATSIPALTVAQVCIEAHVFPLSVADCESWKASLRAVVRIAEECIGSTNSTEPDLSFDIRIMSRNRLHFASLVEVERSEAKGSTYKYFGLVLRRGKRDTTFERVGGG